MQTQHTTRCPVYLHPASASCPATIAHIQRETGQLIVISATKRPALRPRPFDNGPWDGGSAA